MMQNATYGRALSVVKIDNTVQPMETSIDLETISSYTKKD